MKRILVVFLLSSSITAIASDACNTSFANQSTYAHLVDCEFFRNGKNEDANFIDLSQLRDARPHGYLARINAYVVGPRYGHILFSTSQKPLNEDDIYEIIVQSVGNKYAVIRRRMYEMAIKSTSDDSHWCKQKAREVRIDISIGGNITVFLDNHPKPLVSAYDTKPLPIQYISFVSYSDVCNVFVCSRNLKVSNDADRILAANILLTIMVILRIHY